MPPERRAGTRFDARQATVLIADDNIPVRQLIAEVIASRCDVAVIEAEDGAHAVRLGLRHRPGLALLDLHMPRLDGIRAAEAFRGLLPSTSVALHSADYASLRERARHLDLPLFDKLDLEAMAAWVALRHGRGKRDLACASCGYGVVVRTPPRQCPLCHSVASWVELSGRSAAAVR